MGGKKKISLKQMEKTQQRKDKSDKEKQRKESMSTERKSTGIILPELNDGNVIRELKRMKVLTPYTVASHLDLRLSVAKDLLEELRQRGIISYVSGGRNTKIYKAAE